MDITSSTVTIGSQDPHQAADDQTSFTYGITPDPDKSTELEQMEAALDESSAELDRLKTRLDKVNAALDSVTVSIDENTGVNLEAKTKAVALGDGELDFDFPDVDLLRKQQDVLRVAAAALEADIDSQSRRRGIYASSVASLTASVNAERLVDEAVDAYRAGKFQLGGKGVINYLLSRGLDTRRATEASNHVYKKIFEIERG